jgi:predicted phosphate transport protein (TIGR00153 family)
MIGVKKKEDEFFQLLIEFSGKIVKAGEAFSDLVNNYTDVEDKAAGMKIVETECDMQTHKIMNAIRASFVTPFDREDIYEIANEMDAIVDSLEEVANRFVVFDVKELKPAAIQMTANIMQAIRELEVLFKHLSEVKKTSIVKDQIIEVNRIENEGDILYRKSLAELFREEKDPIELIKWKHLYEQLEHSLDSCEHVANIIEGVVTKYA